jgi:hypothetical protein
MMKKYPPVVFLSFQLYIFPLVIHPKNKYIENQRSANINPSSNTFTLAENSEI